MVVKIIRERGFKSVFSGIVEAQSQVLSVDEIPEGLRISVSRPNHFHDIKNGDSIAVDGVCLTVESFSDSAIQFCVSPETLNISKWNKSTLMGRPLNLERSLRYGDRIHGHLVSGHVEGKAQVIGKDVKGDVHFVTLEAPYQGLPYLTVKGSVALNGVSLTINSVSGKQFEVCLIPETIKRTNLSQVKIGDYVNFESDYFIRSQQLSSESRSRFAHVYE